MTSEGVTLFCEQEEWAVKETSQLSCASPSLYWNKPLLPLMNASPLCTWEKALFRLLPCSNTNVEMGLDSVQVCIMLHIIWLSCCALGLLAISTSRTENLASSMSHCAFLADMHRESKSKSMGCFIIHCSIQNMLLPKQTDGSLLSGNRAKLLSHTKSWHSHQFSRELHKTLATVHWVQDDLSSRQHIRD